MQDLTLQKAQGCCYLLTANSLPSVYVESRRGQNALFPCWLCYLFLPSVAVSFYSWNASELWWLTCNFFWPSYHILPIRQMMKLNNFISYICIAPLSLNCKRECTADRKVNCKQGSNFLSITKGDNFKLLSWVHVSCSGKLMELPKGSSVGLIDLSMFFALSFRTRTYWTGEGFSLWPFTG